ncbi:hypothetical protein D3C72_1753160 [compost metagenome]
MAGVGHQRRAGAVFKAGECDRAGGQGDAMRLQQRARKDGLRQRQRQGVAAGGKEHRRQLAQRQRGTAG